MNGPNIVTGMISAKKMWKEITIEKLKIILAF